MSILVADMVGSTTRIANLDPDEAAELFDRVYTHFSAAVEAEGGGFVSFAGDGGVAVFGWPESQEDHADRACLAAWAIQEKMMRPGGLNANDVENVHFRVGVHSGLVGLRQISLHFGRMLDTVGGTVHLAATLEKKAKPGEIQISTATADLCRCELDIEAGPGVPALEKTGATALRLRARPAPPPGLTRVAERPVVGRSEEREVLADAVRAARTSFKSIGMIGEPGIGKSHLAISAIDAAKTEVPEIKLAVFNGDARMRSTPFAAARSIIADLAEPLGLGEKAEASDLLNALNIASEFPGAAETVFGQSAEALDPRPTSTEVGRTFAAMIAALSAQAPLLLIVEDLHLLDPESAVCLEILSKAPEETHGFLLLTSRPEGRATLDRVAQEIREIIAMAPSDLRALAKAVSEDVNSDPHHLELAIERSGGVPFILEQLLLSDDVKALERRDAMPQTVQSLIHARLNRLSNETKQTAQVLSILGERVDIALAQQMLSLSTTEMMAQMAELDSLSLIRPAPGSEIRFAHAIVADACSVTVPRS
ncbi:MAG: adenylate/guanylate cyclase domain-containing protein, partial [Pseudomonadota bacterium]